MTSATGVYRASIAAGLLLGGLTLTAAGRSLAAIPLERPSLAELSDACGQLLPTPTLVNLTALALASLAMTVVLVGARSLLHGLLAQRTAGRACGSATATTICDQSVLVLPDPRPRAFCVGLLRPRVVLSQGALARLSTRELAAVIAHERHHVEQRDALRMLSLRVLADALFFVPLARRLADRHRALLEIAADERAARKTGTGALARALLTFADEPGAIGIGGERVDALRGRPTRAKLPIGLLLGALLTVAGLAALTLWHAHPAPDADNGGAAATSQSQLCVLLLLAVPIVTAAGLFLRDATRWRPHGSSFSTIGSARGIDLQAVPQRVEAAEAEA